MGQQSLAAEATAQAPLAQAPSPALKPLSFPILGTRGFLTPGAGARNAGLDLSCHGRKYPNGDGEDEADGESRDQDLEERDPGLCLHGGCASLKNQDSPIHTHACTHTCRKIQESGQSPVRKGGDGHGVRKDQKKGKKGRGRRQEAPALHTLLRIVRTEWLSLVG